MIRGPKEKATNAWSYIYDAFLEWQEENDPDGEVEWASEVDIRWTRNMVKEL